jgi:membrane-associated phospholipid phosphatase
MMRKLLLRRCDDCGVYRRKGPHRLYSWKCSTPGALISVGRSTARLSAILVLLTFPLLLLAQERGSESPSLGETKADSADARGEPSDPKPELKWYSMFTNIPGDWTRYGRVTFRSGNVQPMVGMVLLTGALIVTDDQTWTMSDRFYKGSKEVKRVSDFFEYLGDGRPQFGLAGAFAAYGFVFKDQRALRTASQTVEAILACGTVVQVLKHVTGRESPFLSTRAGGRWDFFPNQIEYHKHVPRFDAYPSGHIATALATVTVVAENYPEWTWVKPVGYPIVALIGISMANTGIHWYSDYPLGLALGYAFGMLAAHPEGVPEEARAKGKETGFSVSPMINATASGVSLAYTF